MSANVDGNTSVKGARDYELYEAIARVTGLSERTVRSKLESAHGAMQLRNVFAQWPERSDELGAWSAAFARAQRVAEEIPQKLPASASAA